MSTFEDSQYRWRETYFVLFPARQRPTLTQMERALGQLSDRFVLEGLQADEEGRFESVTLKAPEDGAALDVCYTEGDEVLEQGEELAEELAHGATGADLEKIKRIPRLDARLDVLHFQDIADAAGEEDLDEAFDPSALLVVLEALVELTQGIAVDPQSGTLV